MDAFRFRLLLMLFPLSDFCYYNQCFLDNLFWSWEKNISRFTLLLLVLRHPRVNDRASLWEIYSDLLALLKTFAKRQAWLLQKEPLTLNKQLLSHNEDNKFNNSNNNTVGLYFKKVINTARWQLSCIFVSSNGSSNFNKIIYENFSSPVLYMN